MPPRRHQADHLAITKEDRDLVGIDGQLHVHVVRLLGVLDGVADQTLEDDDDVQRVTENFDISDTILEALGAEYVSAQADNDPADGDGCEDTPPAP